MRFSCEILSLLIQSWCSTNFKFLSYPLMRLNQFSPLISKYHTLTILTVEDIAYYHSKTHNKGIMTTWRVLSSSPPSPLFATPLCISRTQNFRMASKSSLFASFWLGLMDWRYNQIRKREILLTEFLYWRFRVCAGQSFPGGLSRLWLLFLHAWGCYIPCWSFVTLPPALLLETPQSLKSASLKMELPICLLVELWLIE